MAVLANLFFDRAVAARARYPVLGLVKMKLDADALSSLHEDEAMAVLLCCSSDADDNVHTQNFHVPYIPKSFEINSDGEVAYSCRDDIVRMIAMARTPITQERLAIAKAEVAAIKAGRVPDARVIGVVIDGMLVTRAHTLDLTPEYREFLDLQKSIPGVVDEPTYSGNQIVPIVPKADPIRKTSIALVAADADGAEEQCSRIIERVFWIAAEQAKVDDPDDIVRIKPSEDCVEEFDAPFPVMDGTFRVREKPSEDAVRILRATAVDLGANRDSIPMRRFERAESGYEYCILAAIVRLTPAEGSPVTGMLVECRVKASDGTVAIKGVFVPTER